jgi:hypothetical protein
MGSEAGSQFMKVSQFHQAGIFLFLILWITQGFGPQLDFNVKWFVTVPCTLPVGASIELQH